MPASIRLWDGMAIVAEGASGFLDNDPYRKLDYYIRIVRSSSQGTLLLERSAVSDELACTPLGESIVFDGDIPSVEWGALLPPDRLRMPVEPRRAVPKAGPPARASPVAA
jgi:hypothetical protein